MDCEQLKARVFALTDEMQPLFEEVCDAVFHHPELGLAEAWSSDYLVKKIEAQGFAVQKPYCGLETAFRAEKGNGGPKIAFLAEYGWEVSAEPVQTQQVRVPEEPGEVFLRYNELQVSQGYDLLQYSGQELTRYVYQVTNYPDSSGTYYATLLVKDGQIVGADIASSAKNGVMHGLKMP